ncbi:MAG: alpha/beta fold hydrolase [Acidimicrobiales bacterium]
MTAVFVHGVPETTAVWGPLVAELRRDDVELLALPGFGTPMPDGFGATKDEYATWLMDELTRFDEVDLVGHDWGALLVVRAVSLNPSNVRSWATDFGDLSESFTWHDTARIWQTPGDGEAFMEGWLAATGAERGAMLAAVGAPQPAATAMGEAIDETMSSAILSLYRSATEVAAEWGPAVDAITAPGLALSPTEDAFGSPNVARRLHERTGATVAEIPGAGHWWMLEVPDLAADLLHRHWDSVGR